MGKARNLVSQAKNLLPRAAKYKESLIPALRSRSALLTSHFVYSTLLNTWLAILLLRSPKMAFSALQYCFLNYQ